MSSIYMYNLGCAVSYLKIQQKVTLQLQEYKNLKIRKGKKTEEVIHLRIHSFNENGLLFKVTWYKYKQDPMAICEVVRSGHFI